MLPLEIALTPLLFCGNSNGVHSSFSPRSYYLRILYILIVAGSIARIGIIAFQHPFDWLVSDGGRHWQNGMRFFDPGFIEAIDPFLYQLWLHLLQEIFGKSWFAHWFFAALLSLAFPWTWYRFAREVLRTKAQALVVWGILIWLPSTFFMYCYFMNETLLLPILGLALWMTARSMRVKTVCSFVVAALFWGLACQTRAVALPLAGVAMLYVSFSARNIRPVVVSALMICLCAIPAIVRSYPILNFVAPFGSSVFNKIYFASGARTIEMDIRERGHFVFESPSFSLGAFDPLSNWRTARVGRYRIDVSLARGLSDWDLELQRASTVGLPLLVARYAENLVFLMVGHEWPEANRDNWCGLLCLYSRFLWPPLILLCLLLSFVFFSCRKMHLLPVLCLASMGAVLLHSDAVNEGRFRIPLEPLILIAVFYLVDNLRIRQGQPLVVSESSGDRECVEACRTE